MRKSVPRKLRSMQTTSNMLAVTLIGEILQKLGAPWSLPPDEILLSDIDALQDFPAAERRKILREAKYQPIWRVLEERIKPLAGEPYIPTERTRTALQSLIQECEDHRRRLTSSRFDGFEKDIRRQLERMAEQYFGDEGDDGPAQTVPVVYFVGLTDPTLVKIGHASRFEHRLRAFKTATPGDVTVHLVIPGDRELEAQLHQRFAAYRVGREWFRLSPEIEAFIAAEKAKGRKL